MIHGLSLGMALQQPTEQADRFNDHYLNLGDGPIMGGIWINLATYLQALVIDQRIEPTQETERILKKVNDALDLAAFSYATTEDILTEIERYHMPYIAQALKLIGEPVYQFLKYDDDFNAVFQNIAA